jgi:D-alanyl-D-alanine carboxypeptidase
MLNSANDASVVIAEGLAGSVPAFARTMNSQARSIGARNTHFVNPNGLPAENHYASARDLATIFGYAMQNREFANIVATKSTMIQPLEGSRRSIALRNHNRLLHDYHIHVVGKTGWTRASKRCFVGAGYADGRELLVAVLGSNDLWADLRALLEFGFEGGVPPIPENAPASITASRSESAPSPKRAKKVAASKQPAPKYAVRLATFQSIDRAKRLRATMTRKGYPARIITVRQDRRTWYRVSVGNYKTRQEAQRAATRMQRIDPSLRTIIVALG